MFHRSALTRVFGCAQVTSVFHNTTIFADVTTQFNELRQKFVDAMDNKLNYPSGHVYSYPLFPDEFTEISWSISRDPKKGYASWMIAWTYLSRSKLKEPPKNNKSQAGGSKILFDNHNSDEPDMLIQTTAKKPGAIVYLKCFGDEDTLGNWLGARLSPYKILSVQDNTVKLRRLRDNKITNKAEHQIELMEKNQGKAGALNVALMYFKRRGAIWCKKNNIDPETKQFLMGIVDARHMVLEPNIFWNDALPFLSGLRSCRPTTIFNRHSGENQMCLNVQYPQYFVNITEDYLDNRNGAYYTMGQTLRDCAKVTTSSGTNAIWDVSRRNFEFATTSRIEDTGTSHKYIAGAFSIHLPCFVAYGVAKTTNDYIEAVYRWSTGAVELFYASFFSSSDIIHFVFIGFICFCFWFACFAKSIFWYLIWLFILVVAMCKSNIDRNSGAKPLRNVVVSSVIVLNTMYWLSNLMSVVWMILMPICIAFYSKVPLSDSVERSLFWAFAAILLRLPTAIMYDQLAAMCRFLMPNTKVWSFNMLLWRSSQLYSCSAGYTALSIMTGTGNYIASRWSAKDLTSWSSFKVAETTVEEAKQKWLKTRKSTNWSMCSLAYWTTLLDYLLILIM